MFQSFEYETVNFGGIFEVCITYCMSTLVEEMLTLGCDWIAGVFEKHNNYPYLKDKQTIDFVKQNKVMFIMRGLPGSGKSYLASLIKRKYKTAAVSSADHYFYDKKGNYNYDSTKLETAHAHCQHTIEYLCSKNINVVVVDNTNLKFWEMKPYFHIAYHHDYIPIIASPQTPWALNSKQLSEKNSHGVNIDIIQKKLAKFSPCLPIYYGWFLALDDGLYLRSQCAKYFGSCLQHFEEFKKNLMEHFVPTGDEQTMKPDYYHWMNRNFHVTACYLGRSKYCDPLVTEYYCKVLHNMGRSYKLKIVGFVYTEMTVGAKVELQKDQVRLWNNMGDRHDYPVSRAHITIAVSDNVAKAQTGIDVMTATVAQQSLAPKQTLEHEDVVMYHYDNTAMCQVLLNEPIFVDSLFGGFYGSGGRPSNVKPS